MLKKIGLNLGCGRRIKQSTEEMKWINCDSYKRENKLDVICDLTKEFPFDDESYQYVYIEHFLEHLNKLDGEKLLINCYKCLKKNGILRLILPHYKKIFQKYLDRDQEFFKPFFDTLNGSDYDYYSRVYNEPEKVREERKENLPPDWHLSSKLEDRKRLKLRVRKYKYLIEIIDYFCHQYSEHKMLYDFESLNGILKEIGFSNVYETEIKDIDSHQSTREKSSLYVESIK